MHFIVSWGWYEDYSPIIMEGPEVNNWVDYCESLLPEAGIRAIEDQTMTFEDGVVSKSYVGWDSVMESLVSILEEKGYVRAEFPEYAIFGSTIIKEHEQEKDPSRINSLTPKVFHSIVRHNEEVRNKLYDEEDLVD